MNCDHASRIGAYKDGELPAADASRMAAHLAACPACAAEFSRLERLSHWFGAAKSAAASPHATWRARLNERRLERLATALTAAAAVVLIASGAMLAIRRDTTTTATAATPQPASRVWERVAVSHSFEAVQQAESEDPMVQILFQDPHP